MKQVIKDLIEPSEYSKISNELFTFTRNQLLGFRFIINDAQKDALYNAYVIHCNAIRDRPVRRRLFNKLIEALVARKDTLKALNKTTPVAGV